MNETVDARHPIRVVAQRTGLTPATIRAWERRYHRFDIRLRYRSDGRRDSVGGTRTEKPGVRVIHRLDPE